MIYINYELSFDRYHKNVDHIVRVYATFTNEGVAGAWVQTHTPLASFLQNKFPEIVKTVRISQLPKGLVSSGDKNFYEERILIADSTIFELFSFPLIIGNPKVVLTQPNTVIVTESIAEKYFGKSDPIGKIIHYNRAIDLTVTGIMKNIPENSHL